MTGLAAPVRSPIAKPIDSWWTVLAVDPLAVPVARLLAPHRRITPTGITLTSAAVAVVGIALLAVGPLPAAALVLYLRFFLDCLDGKLARARGQTSAFGGALDVVVDTLAITGAHTALALRVFDDGGVALWGLLLVGAPLLTAWLRGLRREGATPSSDPDRPLVPGTRLRRQPSTVEAEALTLTLAPLTGNLTVVRGAIMVAVVYYLANSARSIVVLLRTLRRADAAATAP